MGGKQRHHGTVGQVTRSRGYFRTASRVQSAFRADVERTIRALAEEHPNLPAASDVATSIPPARPTLARPVGVGGWWVYYDVMPDGVFIVVVAGAPP